jgi:hypothetical protein
MASDGYKRGFDGLVKSYLSLGDNAETIVRKLKKMPTADTRSILVRELRSLDWKRLELLDQMDHLAKST